MMEDLGCSSVTPDTSVALLSCLTTEVGVPLTEESEDSNKARSLFLGVTIKGVFVDSSLVVLLVRLDSLEEGVPASLEV